MNNPPGYRAPEMQCASIFQSSASAPARSIQHQALREEDGRECQDVQPTKSVRRQGQLLPRDPQSFEKFEFRMEAPARISTRLIPEVSVNVVKSFYDRFLIGGGPWGGKGALSIPSFHPIF
jgi:hypothetical protein